MSTDMYDGRKTLFRVRVLWELVRYDVLFAWRGMRGVRPRRRPAAGREDRRREAEICEAVRSVAPFYWKPIRCLQRSMVTARLMRSHGIPAEVVVGYRPTPFFGHAWVEVAGRVANDSPVYQARLQVLERL
jgi:Transglutaminase-like superfamily